MSHETSERLGSDQGADPQGHELTTVGGVYLSDRHMWYLVLDEQLLDQQQFSLVGYLQGHRVGGGRNRLIN